MREKLGANALPILIPIGAEDQLKGQIDVVNQKADHLLGRRQDGLDLRRSKDIPAKRKEIGRDRPTTNSSTPFADLDDEIGTTVPRGKADHDRDAQGRPSAALTIANKFVPVPAAPPSRTKACSIWSTPSSIIFPSPLDIPPAKGMNPDDHGARSRSSPDDNAKFCSLAFKLWTDPFVGKLVFFRVYSGKLNKGDTIYNPRTRKRERVSRLILIQADKRKDIDTCYSGDIAAMVGLQEHHHRRHALRRGFSTILLEPPTFPEPVISHGRRAEDQGRPGKDGRTRLQRLAEEDPTFRVFTNEETGQTIIAGMGELHLEIIRDRCSASSKSRPTPASRRSPIAKPSPSRRMAKASSSSSPAAAANTATSSSRSSPTKAARASRSRTRSSAARFPKEYIPAVIKGIEEAVHQRRHRRLPGDRRPGRHRRRLLPRSGLQRTRVQDGGHLRVEGRASRRRSPILLEPIMKVESTTPDEYQGDIMGDINRRRGTISGIEAKSKLSHRQRRSAAGRNVRLRHGHPLALQGPRLLLDGALALRAGPDKRA